MFRVEYRDPALFARTHLRLSVCVRSSSEAIVWTFFVDVFEGELEVKAYIRALEPCTTRRPCR